MAAKLTVIEHIRACAMVAKNFTSGMIVQIAETTAGAIEELQNTLKKVAFSGSYSDLADTPESMKNPNTLTLTVNGTSTVYDGSSAQGRAFYAPTTYGMTGRILVGDGSGAPPVWMALPYATCSTASETSAKTASIVYFKLVTGAVVRVKFLYKHNSTTAATLNIYNTGSKPIVVNESGVNTSVTSNFTWSDGEIVTFLYDGTNWIAIDSDMGFIHPTVEDMNNKADKLTATNFTIPTNGWNTDSSVSGYPYYYDLFVSGVTTRDRAIITIAPNSQNTAIDCGVCPTNETYENKIRIRSTDIPSKSISAEYWIEKGKEN